MSQVELASSATSPIQFIAPKGPDIPFIVVVTMFAVAIALSILSLVLPGWVFQPSDLTAFPLP
jgi:hypothetical protein